jgi:ribosome-associated protein YbcJ (S4-like RNA binding protein)
MQEKAVRFNEELTRRGKKLEQLSGDEFLDIADRIKMDEKT